MEGLEFEPNYDNDEEEDEDINFWSGRDGLVIAVDCSATMFEEENEDCPSKFQSCLACIESVMKNTIISSEKDLIGIVLFNTEHSPKPPENVDIDFDQRLIVPSQMAIYLPMQMPSADAIKQVQSLTDATVVENFHNLYGHSTNVKFADLMWLCSRMFRCSGYRLQSLKIMLFTDNDQPVRPNSKELEQSLIRANDLNQLGVELLLVPMTEHFDCKHFYEEFILIAHDIELSEFTAPVFGEQQEDLLQRVFRKDYRKKCNHHLKMSLAEGLELGVCLFSMITKIKYPKRVTLNRDTSEIVIAKITKHPAVIDDSESGKQTLLPSEQMKYQKIAAEKILFTPTEVTEIKNILPPGIKVLGFKDKSALDKHEHFKPCLFLYPDEARIEGSTTLFRSLWSKCIELEKIIMCVLVLRRKTIPAYVFLVPQQLERNQYNHIIRNDGFRVVFLPCQDDIRKLDVFNWEVKETDSNAMEIFQKLTKKLKFMYTPEVFGDPKLRILYSNIEALALDTEREEHKDITLPDVEYQDSKIAELIDQLKEIFDLEDKKETKKRVGDGSSSQKAKLPRTEVHNKVIRNALANKMESKLTVLEMRACLQSYGLSGISKLSKADLIEKLREVL